MGSLYTHEKSAILGMKPISGFSAPSALKTPK
jgi:hypothetical protein